MAREARRIDRSDEPELLRLVGGRGTNELRILGHKDEVLEVVRPLSPTPKQPNRKAKTAADH